MQVQDAFVKMYEVYINSHLSLTLFNQNTQETCHTCLIENPDLFWKLSSLNWSGIKLSSARLQRVARDIIFLITMYDRYNYGMDRRFNAVACWFHWNNVLSLLIVQMLYRFYKNLFSFRYNASEFIDKNRELAQCIDQIEHGFFSPERPDLFKDVANVLRYHDRYECCCCCFPYFVVLYLIFDVRVYWSLF